MTAYRVKQWNGKNPDKVKPVPEFDKTKIDY